jgi:hypothetical protein
MDAGIVDSGNIGTKAAPCLEFSAYLSRIGRADERTRTADLTSLRVINRALQGFAQGCKSRVSKRFSLLWLTLCCTLLRSRWYQSGINIVLLGHCMGREIKDRKRVLLSFRYLCKWVNNSENTRVSQNSYSQVRQGERLPWHHQSTT